MASFFQPVVYDPNADYTSDAASKSRFLVYSNSILSSAELLSYWYQYLLLILGAVAFIVPLLKVAKEHFQVMLWRRRSRRKDSTPEISHTDRSSKILFEPSMRKLSKGDTESFDSSSTYELVELPSLSENGGETRKGKLSACLSSVRTFRHLREGDISKFLELPYDLHILSIQDVFNLDHKRRSDKETLFRNSLAGPADNDPDSPSTWAAIDKIDFSITSFLHQEPAELSRALKKLCFENSITGLVVDAQIHRLQAILKHLAEQNVPVLLSTDASRPVDGVNLGLLCGQIFQNACILPDGCRRDFFHAAKLRSALACAALARQKNPNFFIGFHDEWRSQPSPAVIRRSHKFAKFHDAIFAHGPATNGDVFVSQVCFGAFDWLKRDDVIEALHNWMKSFQPMTADDLSLSSASPALSQLNGLIPGIIQRFALSLYSGVEGDGEGDEWWTAEDDNEVDPPDVTKAPPRSDFWRMSSQGRQMCDAGCFDLREELFDEQYFAVVSTQKHLQSLNMLQEFSDRDMTKLLRILDRYTTSTPDPHPRIVDLARGLRSSDVIIFQGLDSGFTLPDCHGHFWAVSKQCPNDQITLYVSLKAPDLATTVVHCYLAHLGVPRRQRFEIEMDVLESEGGLNQIHPRICSELESATYSELLFLVEQLSITKTSHPILDTVLIDCERLLIEETSKLSYIHLHSDDLLAQKVSIRDVLQARLRHLARQNLQMLPDIDSLVELYSTIDNAINSAQLSNDASQLELLTAPIFEAYRASGSPVDVSNDIYALLFFCSLRRRAFEEVFMETTDRCPLFLQQHDQAAVFAELWVLGSQCERYFGIKPRALGHIIYDEYRKYLVVNPPPIESWNGVDVFTAYHKVQEQDAQILAGSEKKTPLAFRSQLAKASFFTIFCVPAIVDICLLTFLGRGLYLTAFMTLEERIMVNYATLASLLMTAGVSGWSGSAGGFYLYQSAFYSLNHFMVHCLSGGFVLTVLLAFCGFFAFAAQYSWYGGFIFAAYLMVLSTYLNLLGIMSTMHRDGTPFTSGRLILWKCLVITLISPVLSSFVNKHDVLIYLIVLYFFLAVLVYNYSKLCHEWTSWTEKVIVVKESEILDWYKEHCSDLKSESEKSTSAAEAKAHSARASEKLLAAVENPQAHLKDTFVGKLAAGHKYVLWLLKKESNGQPLPTPYSSTWLVQTKLALANQQQINRGLKEHSPFLLFRNAKYDLAQNVGLFLVALLDRWIAVSMSANGHVVNMYYNVRARYGIAFGLLYFLLSAVSLDVVLQRYWGNTGRQSSARLGNIFDFESMEAAESRREKKRWFQALSELFWVMVCVFGFTTILLWLFVIDLSQVILYFAYILGYSAVIVFQFNRVFTMDIKIHVQIVFTCAACGYLIGVVLHEIPQTQNFRFNDVIALCIASMSAAFGTWLYTDFCDDASQDIHVASEEATNWKLYSQKLIGRQNTCARLNTAYLRRLEGVECLYDDCASTLSNGIKQAIVDAIQAPNATICKVLPRAIEVLEFTRDLWIDKKLKLLAVDREKFISAGGVDIFAGSFRQQGTLTVVVGLPSKAVWKNVSEREYQRLVAKLTAEAMLHECCEAMMGMSHSTATIVELILSPDDFVSSRMLVQFAWAETAELRRIFANTNRELLRHLALGCDINTAWESTPEDVRKAVLLRALGRPLTETRNLKQWLTSRSTSLEFHDLHIRQCLSIHEAVSWRIRIHEKGGAKSQDVSYEERHWRKPSPDTKESMSQMLATGITAVYEFFFTFLTFVAMVSRAGTDCGRELWYTMSSTPFQPFIVWAVLIVWKVCWRVKNLWVQTILLSRNTIYKQYHDWLTKGAVRTLTNGLVVESHPHGFRSGFLCSRSDGFDLKIYDGLHKTEPKAQDYLSATYDQKGRLDHLVLMKPKAEESTHWSYSYRDGKYSQYPLSRNVLQGNSYQTYQSCQENYDEHGRVVTGECLKHNLRYRFEYTYDNRSSYHSTDILSATFISVGSGEHTVYQVFWSLPSPKDHDGKNVCWIPSERVHSFTTRSATIYEDITWTYDHKMDPTIRRTFRSLTTGATLHSEILEFYLDELGMLAKPTMISFVDDNLLFFHKLSAIKKFATHSDKVALDTASSPRLLRWVPSRFRSLSLIRDRQVDSSHKLSTTVLRNSLWKQWSSSTNLDAMTACLVDEMILREEPTLEKYWSFRDAGRFSKAKAELESNLETIVSSIEFSDEVSQKISLAIKPADLFTMGLSKDANFVTSKPEASYIDTDNRVAVIFTDTGCWPDAPGGVSNCRRDLVDGHKTIRNYALTESANEYGIPRFKMERNVQLIKNISLWGLDGKCPSNGLFENLLQSQVETRIRKTRTKEDIVDTFIPLLTAFVRGSRTHRLTRENLTELTDVILNINAYFEENDYLTTWRSKEVRKAWREAWLCEYSSSNISNPNDAFDIERPTGKEFDEALELFISYFFVFSIRVPEHVPRVYQSTHHGISSLYGMILKIRRGTTWGIWDHAIMLRESLLNISPAQCILPISVQTMLIGAMKVAAHLAYTHADIILPCTAIYNPTWEAEIGSDQGHRSSPKHFYRKIDPITNGISSMDKFKPVGKPRTAEPTAIMLSNVQFIKDVKTAILAAGVIINDFGFKNYNLVVYGAQDRQPSYAIETEELISRLGIGKTVKLGGFGSPSQVLKDAWLFMNSSLSEGLPLAIGEAALSGVPIVATEVGATAQVLTDADDPNILYGEIVPPNDPVELGRAQIRLLAMLGPWAKYTTDDTPPSDLPAVFTPQDVEWITSRMYEKVEDRQALGLRLREVVLRKFNGDRYLREHEQMYWVQRHMAEHRADQQLEQIKHSHPRFGEILEPKRLEPPQNQFLKGHWQEFDRKNL